MGKRFTRVSRDPSGSGCSGSCCAPFWGNRYTIRLRDSWASIEKRSKSSPGAFRSNTRKSKHWWCCSAKSSNFRKYRARCARARPGAVPSPPRNRFTTSFTFCSVCSSTCSSLKDAIGESSYGPFVECHDDPEHWIDGADLVFGQALAHPCRILSELAGSGGHHVSAVAIPC